VRVWGLGFVRAADRGEEGVGGTWWAVFAGEEIGGGGTGSRRRQRGRERGLTAAGVWEGEDEADWWLLGLLRCIYFRPAWLVGVGPLTGLVLSS